MTIGRNELLYDKELLGEFLDEFENANKIKEHVKTNAFVYEIRTAIHYWFGGQNTWRCNDNVWDRCEAVDEGNLTLVGDTLKYEEDLRVSEGDSLDSRRATRDDNVNTDENE